MSMVAENLYILKWEKFNSQFEKGEIFQTAGNQFQVTSNTE